MGEDAVIANFGRAGWQEVLKEAMNELDAGKRHLGNPQRSWQRIGQLQQGRAPKPIEPLK